MRRIELKAERPDADLVSEVARAVRDGRLVALPTETVYGIAADPDDAGSVARLRASKGSSEERRFTHHVATTASLGAVAPPPPPRVRRMLARYWPGPITLVLPDREGREVGVRVPAHPFTSAVLEQFPRGLYLSSANAAGARPAVTAGEVAQAFPDLDVLVDAGATPLGQASTVVRWRPPRLEVVREGTLTRDEVLRAAASTVLFVCTGNTCRSPMAEALARRALAASLGIEPDELLASGAEVASAGMVASSGAPASTNAVQAAAEVGLDLSGHRTRLLEEIELDRVVLAYGMSWSHVERAAALAPGLTVQLLDPDGSEVTDPFGGELEIYRAARDAIGRGIEARLDEMVRALRDAG